MKNGNSNSEMALVTKSNDSRSLDVLALDLTNDFQGAMDVLTKIVSSKKYKQLTTPEVALSYYLKTKELDVPFISSLDHIFNINGRTSIDVHLMRALVLRAGVVHWEEIHNNAPLYKYIDGTGNVIATGFTDDELPYGFEIPQGKTEQELTTDAARIISIGKIPVVKQVDIVALTATDSRINVGTKYKFTRLIKMVNGTFKTITEYGQFTLREAVSAGLHLKEKGTVVDDHSPWLVYTRNMNESRAWTFGCRKIADDITFGLPERTEQYDIDNVSYTVVDEEVVTVGANGKTNSDTN